MTNQENVIDAAPEPLWKLVTLSEYKLPQKPISYRVKGGIAGILQKLRLAEKKPESPLSEEDTLESLPDRLKRFIAEKPDWHPAALTLEKYLTAWSNENINERDTIAVVAPPHVANGAILKHIAEVRDWPVVAPPTAEQILTADDNWLNTLTNQSSPWILPNVEKCYLRCHHGLTLIHRLFALLQNGRTVQGIIGCDSWAWAYFQRVAPELLPPAMTLQAFDHLRLIRWLRDLAPGLQGEHIHFRQSNTGDDVLPLPKAPPNTTASSQFVKDLAAYSRGNPGVAWSIWSNALRSLPEATDDSKASAAALDYRDTIWLPPLERLGLPTSSAVGIEQLLVLHCLLLHTGLAIECLPDVLPLTLVECNQALSAIKNKGLIEHESNEWRVSAIAYPAVRQLLENQGYLTDNF